MLDLIFGNYERRDFSVRLWDGSYWQPPQSEPSASALILRHPGSLRKIFVRPTMLSLGRAYLFDDIDFEGDIRLGFKLGDYLLGRHWTLKERLSLARDLLRHPVHNFTYRKNMVEFTPHYAKQMSRRHIKDSISYHYELPLEFFQLWLDKNMVYSGAYFLSAEDDLETAQLQKLDYICKKLRLEYGEKLLDLGCGWGALIIHAAKHYGVKAYGITVSQDQAAYANKRIKQEGLASTCCVETMDFRDLDAPNSYDKLASVGMAEHVLKPVLSEYFKRAHRLLKPGGLFLNQAIASSVSIPLRRGPSFMHRYIFPNTELVSINEALKAAEDAGLEVRDIENLREHYFMTLNRWLSRFEAHTKQVKQTTDEITYRKFRVYLAGCEYDFQHGRLNLFQTLLSKPTGSACRLPFTRVGL